MSFVEFAMIAKHAVIENGALNCTGGVVTTFNGGDTPMTAVFDLAARIGFTAEECGIAHQVAIRFNNQAGQTIMAIDMPVMPVWPDDPGYPTEWPSYVLFAISGINLTFVDVGPHTLNVGVDGTEPVTKASFQVMYAESLRP